MSVAYLALGANLGDRAATILSALRSLSRFGRVTAVSSLYETDPVGYEDQPPYLNAVAALETEVSPERLMDALLAIETEHGRVRSFPNAPRTLDLDLLLYDDEVHNDPSLTLPHPRLHERAFVLVPLVEIAPDVDVPGTGRTAMEILASLGEPSGIALFAAPPAFETDP